MDTPLIWNNFQNSHLINRAFVFEILISDLIRNRINITMLSKEAASIVRAIEIKSKFEIEHYTSTTLIILHQHIKALAAIWRDREFVCQNDIERVRERILQIGVALEVDTPVDCNWTVGRNCVLQCSLHLIYMCMYMKLYVHGYTCIYMNVYTSVGPDDSYDSNCLKQFLVRNWTNWGSTARWIRNNVSCVTWV